MPITKLINPYIKYEEAEEDLKKIFESGIFTSGEYCQIFRQKLSRVLRAKYSHLTTSATTALWISLKLLQIEASDEVIVSDFSFPATANVVEDLGAIPVFADVSLITFNMNPEELVSLINPRTKAVIFVDALGNPSGIKSIQNICKSRGIPLIEDAACAIGSKINGKHCGSFSDISCFSFHPRKLICTGEGGAIVTNNKEWSKWLETKLRHGASSSDDVGMKFNDFGYNFRLSEIQSLLGSIQLDKLEIIIKERNKIRKIYKDGLSDIGFIPQNIEDNVLFNCQSIVFKVPNMISRNKLIYFLRSRNIESTLGTYSMSSNSYYSNKYNKTCPSSRYLEENTITLPCYESLDPTYIIDEINSFCKR